MNDMDSRLRGLASQTPRRRLTPDFTDVIMQRATAAKKQRLVTNRLLLLLKGFNNTKLLHVKHAGLLIGIVGTLIISGGAYAVIRWAGFDHGATYGGVVKLDNGNIRFWVHNDECIGKQFYEIKAGAKITPAEIANMVAGTCEYTDVTALLPGLPIGGTRPKGLTYEQAFQSSEVLTQYYVAQGTVRAVNPDKLQTVGPDMLSVEFSTHDGKNTVWLPLVNGAKAFDKSELIAVETLKAGDPVALILTVQATYATIARHTATWEDGDHKVLPNSSIYAIVKQHHPIYDLSAEGKTFTPLVPDPKDLEGMTPDQTAKYTQDPANLRQEYPLE